MKISLITVAFNSESTIRKTLESVASQKFKNLEYIVIDGASTDSTIKIIREYPQLASHLVSEPDLGIYDAINKGIRLASGEVIGILNSDDHYVTNEVLNQVSKYFSEDSELDALIGGVDFFKGDNISTPVRNYRLKYFKPWMFIFGLMPPHPAVFIKKGAYEKIGLYKNNYKIAGDFEFLLRLFFIFGAKYKIIQKNWVRMKFGGISTGGLKSCLLITQEMRLALKENKIYSNYVFLLTRLPYKFLRQVLWK